MPKFYFTAEADGWEAASVLADFCKQNNIKTQLSLNGHDANPPKKMMRASTRHLRLNQKQVAAIQKMIKDEPDLTDAAIAHKTKYGCSSATVWRIRKGIHRLQATK